MGLGPAIGQWSGALPRGPSHRIAKGGQGRVKLGALEETPSVPAGRSREWPQEERTLRQLRWPRFATVRSGRAPRDRGAG